MIKTDEVADHSSNTIAAQFPENHPIIPQAYADTGCTGNFLCTNSPHSNPIATEVGLEVLMPNKQRIRATHSCTLNLPDIPEAARQGHIFKELAHPLLSIGMLCDNGCTAVFTKKKVKILLNNKTILQGNRCPRTKLWCLPLQMPSSTPPTNISFPTTSNECLFNAGPQIAASAYHTSTKADHVQFLHATCGYPVPSTWTTAIDNGQFTTWPGLTSELVRKHLPKSSATTKGHMHSQRQNIRSTQPATLSEATGPPVQELNNEKTHCVYQAIMSMDTNAIATDLTGRFPVTSSKGNKYILVMYEHDTNNILTEPLKNRSELEHIRAFNKLHTVLSERGFTPKHLRLDIEASMAYKANLRAKNIDFQLVPPHDHKRNPAERAIQTFKNHFIACLCGTDKNFQLHLWCRLLPQATTTLNLLRQSRQNPKLSAHAHLNGAFDFNRTPLAPLGTRVIIHEKT